MKSRLERAIFICSLSLFDELQRETFFSLQRPACSSAITRLAHLLKTTYAPRVTLMVFKQREVRHHWATAKDGQPFFRPPSELLDHS